MLRLTGFLLAACLLWPAAAAAQPEVPAPVRGRRTLAVGFSPAWPWISSHDATVPVPAVRAGVNLTSRLAVELTAGIIPYGASGAFGQVDLGGRWFVLDGALAPYVMARAGIYFDDADEGNDRSYPFGVLGGGLDYSCGCGFTAWAEAGPALISYMDVGPRSLEPGAYVSVGLGYRLGGR